MSQTCESSADQHLLTARSLYGRGAGIQYLIFFGFEAAVFLFLLILSTGYNIALNFIAREGVARVGMVAAAFSYVSLFLSLGGSVGLLFLHRRVTFRSADSVLHNVLPLMGISLGGTLIARIPTAFLTEHLIDHLQFIREHAALIWPASLALTLLCSAATPLAACSAIRLARTPGKAPLCILPILAAIALPVLSSITSFCMSFSQDALFNGFARSFPEVLAMILTTALPLFFSSFLPFILRATSAFFCQRFLVYRDVCDTVPAVQQRLLQRYQLEHPEVFAEASIDPDLSPLTTDNKGA